MIATLVRPVGGAQASAWLRLLDDRNVLSFLFMLPAAGLLLVFLTYPLGLGIWLGVLQSCFRSLQFRFDAGQLVGR